MAMLSFSTSTWFFITQTCLNRTPPVRESGQLLPVPKWLRQSGGRLVTGLGGDRSQVCALSERALDRTVGTLVLASESFLCNHHKLVVWPLLKKLLARVQFSGEKIKLRVRMCIK